MLIDKTAIDTCHACKIAVNTRKGNRAENGKSLDFIFYANDDSAM